MLNFLKATNYLPFSFTQILNKFSIWYFGIMVFIKRLESLKLTTKLEYLGKKKAWGFYD